MGTEDGEDLRGPWEASRDPFYQPENFISGESRFVEILPTQPAKTANLARSGGDCAQLHVILEDGQVLGREPTEHIIGRSTSTLIGLPAYFSVSQMLISSHRRVLLAAVALAADSAQDLETAQGQAKEVVRDSARTGKSAQSADKPLLADAQASAAKMDAPKARRGISASRLHDILARCPNDVQRGILSTLTFANGIWVGELANKTPQARQCLGLEEFRRLEALLKSTTYKDKACRMRYGKCVDVENFYCNDVDCDYYIKNPLTANPHEACFMTGRCSELDYFYCNGWTCRDYVPAWPDQAHDRKVSAGQD